MKEDKLGIVIGSIISINKVNNTDRLFLVEVKTDKKVFKIATSLVSFYKKEDLIGKQIPIKIDVETVTIMGIQSDARFIAIMNKDRTPTLLIPENIVDNGALVM